MRGQPEISPRSLKAYVVGTIDTKGEELRYVRDLIADTGIPTVLVDVSPRSQDTRCDVRSAEVAAYHRASSAAILSNDRGKAIEAMAQAFNEYWIIIQGRGIATSEGTTYQLGPGDMLLTKAGDEHSLIVTEEMVAVYYYGVMPEGGRFGYLYRGVDPDFAKWREQSRIDLKPS